MRLEDTAIQDVKIVHLDAHADHRGLFGELWGRTSFEAIGIRENWVLEGLSRQTKKNTLRGLHFQTPPYQQAKLVRASRGSIFDVAVDIRHGSPTFGKHVSVQLSEADQRLFYIPVGFAHGFCALEDGAELVYKLSAPYNLECSKMGLRWNDPELGIPWPIDEDSAILNDRDRAFPMLRDLQPVFIHGEIAL